MKKLLVLVFVLLSKGAFAAAAEPEDNVAAPVATVAIREVRTFLGIPTTRELHPWEANKALQSSPRKQYSHAAPFKGPLV